MYLKNLPIKSYLLLLLLIAWFNSLSAQTADFTFSSANVNNCEPYPITFTAACTGNPIGYVWNYGNHQRGINPIRTVTYTAGTYQVTLTALFANTAISTTKTITVNPSPTVSLIANKNYLCKPGAIDFIASRSALVTGFEWNFGDSSPIQNTVVNTISHPYQDYGNYTATVKVFTAFGCNVTRNYDIRVSKFGIEGTMSINSGCLPAIPDFLVTTDLPAGDIPLYYSWDFGDGSPIINNGEVRNISHRYTITDTINSANVTITSVQGCDNRFNFPAFAFGNPPVNPNLITALLKDTFCASETIKFYGKATNANVYQWELGDSSNLMTTDTFTTHKYRTLGSQKIIITPFLNGCAGAKDSILIFIKGVIADFTYSNLCSKKTIFQFANLSQGNITHFDWNFSDDTGSKDSVNFNLTHKFPISGSFTTTLSIIDNTTQCTDQAIYNIYTAVPLLNRSTNSACKDSLVTYRVTNSYPSSAGYTYDFHVNGQTISNGADSVLNFYPGNHGSFAEYALIQDAVEGTCSDTLQLNSNIIIKGPVVDFTSPSRLCADKAFSFTNNSYPYYATDPITKWHWDFGDNKKDSVKTPLPHLFTAAYVWNVILTATDVNGCAQSSQRTVVSAPVPQIIAFPAVDTICGLRDTALLTGYTVDTLLWLPSTGINCTSCDTTKVYPASTTSYVAQASNVFGCRSYDTCLIKVYSPLHLRVFPADTAVCPGQPVAYRLGGTIPGVISWSPATYLNNNSVSNPVSIPTGSIRYTVTVKDDVGCYTDSAVVNTNVFPLPLVNAGPDKILPFNTTFSITPVYSPDVVSYFWEPAGSTSCPNCPSISGIAHTTTTFTIKTTSAKGCKYSDRITIFVACEKSNLLLPTAFTPNGNGLNDYFYPIAKGYRMIKTFLIYNRRGNKVFERQNFSPNIPSLGWDGIIKNAETTSATEAFAWYVEAECEQGQTIVNKGTVVLLR